MLLIALPGLGAGIAMFPQASSSLSPWYTKLAQWGMTKDFAVVGWVLMAASAVIVSIVMSAGS